MKTILTLASLLVALAANAANYIQFAWDPVTSSPVIGYKLYQGESSGNYTTNYPATTNLVMIGTNLACTVTISNVPTGKRLYFAVTSFTADSLAAGMESDFSSEVTHMFKPDKPMKLRVTQSTNTTAAIWLDNVPTSTTVQWSGDLQTWRNWARVTSLDDAAPLGHAIFLSGTAPDPARFWRAVQDSEVTQSTAVAVPLPEGMRLAYPPLPGQ